MWKNYLLCSYHCFNLLLLHVVVKADVTTPMKYNYIFLANEESANKYIKESKKVI